MKIKVWFAMLSLLFTVQLPILSAQANSCTPLGAPTLADDGLMVTMNSITTAEKSGSYTLTIAYTQKNSTVDKKLDESSFKLFFKDGTGEPQYGGFNNFFPGDSRDRSYTWEYLKSKEVLAISYNAGFFAQRVDPKKLNWVVPGQSCSIFTVVPTPTPTPTPSKTPTPIASTSSNSTSELAAAVAAMRVEIANLKTDAANIATEASDSLTIIKEEFRDFESAINAAVAANNLSLLPKYNQTVIDARVNSITNKVASLDVVKNALDTREKEVMVNLKKNSRNKELLLEVQKARKTVQSSINRYIESVNNLNSMFTILEKAKASIISASSTTSPSPKVSNPAKIKATIICIKGKSQLQVKGISPICPKGYKKK